MRNADVILFYLLWKNVVDSVVGGGVESVELYMRMSVLKAVISTVNEKIKKFASNVLTYADEHVYSQE